MGKKRGKKEKTLTRKEIAHGRRSRQQERWLFIGLGAVAVVLLIIIGVGLYQEYVGKPASPVAIVDGTPIRTDEYQKRWKYQRWSLTNYVSRLEQQRAQYEGQDESEFLVSYMDQLLQQAQTQLQLLDTNVLDQLIDERLIRAGAQAEGITVTAAEVQEEVERQFGYERNPPTPTATPITATLTITETPTPTVAPMTYEEFQTNYQSYLNNLEEIAGMTEEDQQKLIEAELLLQKLQEVLAARVPTTAEQVQARHILVEDVETANAVLERLNQGESFEELAAELSTDESNKDNGGDLGWFPRGQMVPEFEEAAFSLEVGAVSEPVQTSFGYHIIKVEGHEMERELDEAMLSQTQANALETWLEGQRLEATIERMLTQSKIPSTPTPFAPIR